MLKNVMLCHSLICLLIHYHSLTRSSDSLITCGITMLAM